MTKKDFELIADAIRDVYEYQKDSDGRGSKKIKQGAIRAAADSLSEALARTNPRFDRARFMAACGIDQ